MYMVKPDEKGKMPSNPKLTYNFLSQQECINVFRYANGHRLTTHPTEKPQSFIERLVEVSSNRGDLVVDPFMGGGTTAAACKKLGRRYIGFDTNPEYIEMARKRVASVEPSETAA